MRRRRRRIYPRQIKAGGEKYDEIIRWDLSQWSYYSSKIFSVNVPLAYPLACLLFVQFFFNIQFYISYSWPVSIRSQGEPMKTKLSSDQTYIVCIQLDFFYGRVWTPGLPPHFDWWCILFLTNLNWTLRRTDEAEPISDQTDVLCIQLYIYFFGEFEPWPPNSLYL